MIFINKRIKYQCLIEYENFSLLVHINRKYSNKYSHISQNNIHLYYIQKYQLYNELYIRDIG